MLICWPPQRDGWEHLRDWLLSKRGSSIDEFREMFEILVNKRLHLREVVKMLICWPPQRDGWEHLREMMEILINKRLIYWPSRRDFGDAYQQEARLLPISERWWGYLCINKRLIYWPSQRDFGDDHQQEARLLPISERWWGYLCINKRLIYWPSRRDFGDAYQQEAHFLTIWDKWWRYLLTRGSSVNKLRDMAEILINKMLIYLPFQRDGRDIYQQEVHLLSISERWHRHLSTRVSSINHLKEMAEILIKPKEAHLLNHLRDMEYLTFVESSRRDSF